MDSESITTFVPDLSWFSYENFIDIRVSTTITRQARNWQQENFWPILDQKIKDEKSGNFRYNYFFN